VQRDDVLVRVQCGLGRLQQDRAEHERLRDVAEPGHELRRLHERVRPDARGGDVQRDDVLVYVYRRLGRLCDGSPEHQRLRDTDEHDVELRRLQSGVQHVGPRYGELRRDDVLLRVHGGLGRLHDGGAESDRL
jgi:hypothetical protein